MSPQILDTVLLRTDHPELELHASGKVRDVYNLDTDHLLFVATDRISAFDYVLATGIPHKGRVLTQISLFWFDFLKDIVPNHFVTADVNRYPAAIRNRADELRGRSMMVMRAEMFPVECVARGYLSGSGWKEYKATGTVCGIKLPPGLGIRPAAGAHLHAGDQGHHRARHQHFVRRNVHAGRSRFEPATPRHHVAYLQESRGLRAAARHHHRRHQV